MERIIYRLNHTIFVSCIPTVQIKSFRLSFLSSPINHVTTPQIYVGTLWRGPPLGLGTTNTFTFTWSEGCRYFFQHRLSSSSERFHSVCSANLFSLPPSPVSPPPPPPP